jgi:hypothetical protein
MIYFFTCPNLYLLNMNIVLKEKFWSDWNDVPIPQQKSKENWIAYLCVLL